MAESSQFVSQSGYEAAVAQARSIYGSGSSSSSSGSSNGATQKSSPSSGNSVSQSSGNKTVQAEYISGGKGGTTYLITEADGRQHSIAASGISQADLAKYNEEKAAKAAASGDTEKAAYYSGAAANNRAAANYENATGITKTYGPGTGVTYDATESMQFDPAVGKVTMDNTAKVYQAGHGLEEYSYVDTKGALTVKSDAVYPGTSGIVSQIDVAGTKALNEAINNGTLQIQGTNPAGDLILAADLSDKSTIENINKILEQAGSQSFSTDGQVIATAADYMPEKTAWDTASDFVDYFAEYPTTLASSGRPGDVLMSAAATVALPNDLVGTIKKMTDGRWDEITWEDGLWSVVDALSLIPGVGLLKLGKVGKALKFGSFGIQGAATAGPAYEYTTALLGIGDDTNADPSEVNANISSGDGSKDTNINNTLTQSNQPTMQLAYNPATGTIYLTQENSTTPTNQPQGNLSTENIRTQEADALQTQQIIPSENQGGITSQTAENLALQAALSAALAGAYGAQGGEGSGGGGDGITIINETSGGSGGSSNGSSGSSGLSDAIGQITPYIIPVALVVGGIIALSLLTKKSKSGSRRAAA